MTASSRHRWLGALVALFGYAYALTAAPWLHARHGADHIHGPSGLVAASVQRPAEIAHTHAAFHEDLAALGLGDVADAGVMVVDCRLAAYTLTDCAEESITAHASRFGDGLIDRHHAPPPDPTHGAGSLEHVAAALIPANPPLLPPPATRALRRTERSEEPSWLTRGWRGVLRSSPPDEAVFRIVARMRAWPRCATGGVSSSRRCPSTT